MGTLEACFLVLKAVSGSIGKEEGPKYSPDASENEVRRRNMVEAWIKVWQTEGGPESPAGPEGALIIRPSAKATVRIPVEEPEAMDLDEPEIVTTGPQVDSTLEATQDTGAIEEEGGVQPAGSKESDPEADVVGVAGKKRKRKVPVGGRRIAEPSVGLAENPRQRLKEIAAKAPEQEAEEERPRRKAYLNSPYVSATQGSRADQTSHLGANKESSKKPKAITAKVKATANASAPSSSPRKLTKRQASVESARKTAQAKAAKKAAGR